MDVPWDQKAHRLWLKSAPNHDAELLRNEIWLPLESSDFAPQQLLHLDDLQILERYLWPTYSHDSTNQHVILIALFTNFKRQGNLPYWPIFSEDTNKFSTLFYRVLSLNLDGSLSISARLYLLNFVIGAFQSLERDFVRKECAPLVSIAIWNHLHSQIYQEKEIQKSPARQKAWKSSQKRFTHANKDAQVKLQFERGWLCSMVLDFLRRLQATQTSAAEITYCEQFLEFLTDLISQIPTRRYSAVLLDDLNVFPVLRTSKVYRREENALIRDLSGLYKHFLDLVVEESGAPSSSIDTRLVGHYENLEALQRIAFEHFESKLKVLALSNYASIDKPGELQAHLSSLNDLELETLCQTLGFRTSYPASVGISTGRSLFLEILMVAYVRPQDFKQTIRNLSSVPTDKSLYDPALLRSEHFVGLKPLALPKLNLQYLTLDDFMWRSFQLHQREAFYEIRKDMESIVRRIKPKEAGNRTIFGGFSKMALPIDRPAIVEAGLPNVGERFSSHVRAEVILDVSRLSDRIRFEWDSLRPKDVVFLLGVKGSGDTKISNGNKNSSNSGTGGLNVLRTAEIVQVLDENSKPIRDPQLNGHSGRTRRRRLLLDVDPIAFNSDQNTPGGTKNDVWASINVIARRHGRENNFKPVLETIQRLVGSRTELPSWLQEVYLGYGDPRSASYQFLPMRVEKLDFLDTFLDWKHLKESFPNRDIQTGDEAINFNPPYVLEPFVANQEEPAANPKKRRREQMENDGTLTGPIQVTTYKARNTGPYPADKPKKNSIRFTPKQIDAILSGTQPGLSLIIGPPGTGKTDVATQIINLLYHNFPSERILLVAHSNQTLNQLFQKIVALDIDARHLLRLGHGEDELATETSYSKYGRVESFLENRYQYLSEVNRLATSIGAEGAHGSTCETANYFNKVFIQPAWTKFWTIADSPSASTSSIIQAFPFANYFSNAPVPELIPETLQPGEARDVAKGCQYHLDRIFKELESIRPFEILRNPRDQANHLLIKEARIVAMTSTHAAMRRFEIAELGFQYDTLIMEEAAQVTEIESFIPCAMQKPHPKSGELPLKRMVLVGDHLQNSPVIQNLALRQYANFEQSLFLRLVRLGVPTITLDQQGRCRPSIAELFSWRYDNLSNLPNITLMPEFSTANTGFRYEFQFIDVPDYQGQGEREPTSHFIQNLGEAEYTAAIYQYMRLLGYPAKSISILCMYAGQKALIYDVLEHRCKGNVLFGMPKIVTTVDKYQGEQNDYVILSLVRTKTVGYLRDVRRLTVALSRARLGLYVLGRRELFETCPEMAIAMQRLTTNGNGKLELVTSETFPTTRATATADMASVAVMESVEHLGQYVYEMTQAKIKSMGGTLNLVDANGSTFDLNDEADDIADDLAQEADFEEDPLHENVV